MYDITERTYGTQYDSRGDNSVDKNEIKMQGLRGTIKLRIEIALQTFL